ncbi:MAG: VWA domain-containing protein [Caldilineales bacterium]|nr:VWA domain-containing protein [Caldilineales bacterium]
MTTKKQSTPPPRILIFGLLGFSILCGLCVIFLALSGLLEDSSAPEPTVAGTPDPASALLTLAYSPEKAGLITALVDAFNDARQRTPDRKVMQIQLLQLPPDRMVEEALAAEPAFQALTPDASLWLDQLDLRWAEANRGDSDVPPRRIADSARYAVSPIVIAAWPDVAASLGWGSQPVGWSQIQERAATDRSFKWSHASTSYASGMLATLAEFYAGAGKTRALTEEDVTARSTLDYVANIERTISFYGENEAVTLERLREQGRNFLDAMVVQEALVVQFNRSGAGPLVAIYPHEGTLWQDHPLALLDAATITDNQRRTFRAFADFLRQPEQQKYILDQGYRPADLNIPIDGPDSPLSPANGVDPKEPQTTLQMPGPSVVRVVQNVWAYTKRPSNVFLVVDTSGSMLGDKLANVQTALQTFLDQIQGTQDRVGMVEFGGSVYNITPLDLVQSQHRQNLQDEIARMEAKDDTALFDAIRAAYVRLQQEADSERINAIVVMTDGRENASNIDLGDLLYQIESENRSGVRVVIFAIAYGNDADMATLRAIAEISGGQAREGSLETIRELYRLLSQYF